MLKNDVLYIELPTFYSSELSFYKEGEKFYMSASDYGSGKVQISEEFYLAAIKEFGEKGDFKWEEL